jgi:hypothetical protein
MTIIGNIESGAANATRLLDDIVNRYARRLDRTLKIVEDKMLALTTRISLDARGNVKGPKWTLAQSAKIQGQLERIFDENYGAASRQFANEMRGVADIVRQAHNAVDLPIAFGKVDAKMLNVLQVQTLAGLTAFSTQIQERVAQSIQDSIIAGKSYHQLTKEIRNHITGLTDVAGRSLKQYANVYAQDGLMTSYRRLSAQKAKEAKIKYYVWMGNVVANSRPICCQNAGRMFSEQELQEMDLYSWKAKSCGVFACCGGWNCRHHLMPVSNRYYDEMKGKQIDVPDWFKGHGKRHPPLNMKLASPKTYKRDIKAIGLKPDEARQLREKWQKLAKEVEVAKGKPRSPFMSSAENLSQCTPFSI